MIPPFRALRPFQIKGLTMVDDALVIPALREERESVCTRSPAIRAKPAVFFGGPYRIIDFTLSNCINSGLRRIFIATQYKSLSLNRHIRMGWSIVSEELGEFVEIFRRKSAVSEHWYQGTADAVIPKPLFNRAGKPPPGHHPVGRSRVQDGLREDAARAQGAWRPMTLAAIEVSIRMHRGLACCRSTKTIASSGSWKSRRIPRRFRFAQAWRSVDGHLYFRH
jgi:hypothetical protein